MERIDNLLQLPYYIPGKCLNWKGILSSLTLESHSILVNKICFQERIDDTKEITISNNLLTSLEFLEYTKLIAKSSNSLLILNVSNNLLDDYIFTELIKLIMTENKFEKLESLNFSCNRLTSDSKEALCILLDSDK